MKRENVGYALILLGFFIWIIAWWNSDVLQSPRAVCAIVLQIAGIFLVDPKPFGRKTSFFLFMISVWLLAEINSKFWLGSYLLLPEDTVFSALMLCTLVPGCLEALVVLFQSE